MPAGTAPPVRPGATPRPRSPVADPRVGSRSARGRQIRAKETRRNGVPCAERPPTASAMGRNVRVGDDSERIEAGPEETELVALGVLEHVPRLLPGLPDVGRARAEGQQSLEFGVLVLVDR